MNQKALLTCIFLFALLFQQCKKSVIEEETINELPPLSRIVVYDPEVAEIIDSNCSECHSGDSPSASLDLLSYESVVQQMENGDMWSRLNNSNSPMPPTGILSPTIVQIIEKWSSDGYPEN